MDRFLEAVDEHRPDVAVVGDAYDRPTATYLQSVADELTATYEDVTPVIVPKCADALDAIDQSTVVGYANGYSDITATDFSDPRDWRGRQVHLLGGSPTSQYDAIQLLTQPTLDGAPPADIVGLDTNCFHKVAFKGEYWTADGWQPADHLSIRDTVRRSLVEAKQFWQDVGVWPRETPIDEYGPAVLEPDEPLYAENGGDIQTRDALESVYIATYESGTYAFQSEAAQRFIEFREELTLAKDS